MDKMIWSGELRERAPKIHCLTNPVSMQDVANILLAAGGSAIMAQDPGEAAEITAFCQATLLNTGVPDEKKFQACAAAGRRANGLGHPVILDPVGAGASDLRKRQTAWLLLRVKPTIIRCNPGEATTLLEIRERGSHPAGAAGGISSGGVESGIAPDVEEQKKIAGRLARAYGCVVLLSGETDAISDGERTRALSGGDGRMARITGGGCMLSALCAFFAGAGLPPYEGAYAAADVWKRSARLAGEKTDGTGGGIGSFHGYLFDAVESLCYGTCGPRE